MNIVHATMAVTLLESKVVMGENGHVIFKQRIQPDEAHEATWSDADMSLAPEKDESGHTTESAFLLGIALVHSTTEEEIRARLKQEGVIYLYPPPSD